MTATAPPHGNVAPPGTYYLVVNKRSLQGPIPSVARIVDVGRTDRAEAPQPFPDDAPAPSGGSATADEDTSVMSRMAQVKPANVAVVRHRPQQATNRLPMPAGTLLRRWPFVLP
jgi:hypothetical protein